MITPDYCRLMARYNAWFNERLYAVCADLTVDERKRDRGAFFKSIQGTLAHIVWGDRTWLARFTGGTFDAPAWGQDWIDDFAELARMRAETDQRIADWSEALTPDALAGALTYVRKVDGIRRELPLWVAVTHVFNHQTHHRGQVTTLLSQIGRDPGVTDLVYVPGVMRTSG